MKLGFGKKEESPWEETEKLNIEGLALAKEIDTTVLKLKLLQDRLVENRMKSYEKAPKKRPNEYGDIVRRDTTLMNIRLHMKKLGFTWAAPVNFFHGPDGYGIDHIVDAVTNQNNYIMSAKELPNE